MSRHAGIDNGLPYFPQDAGSSLSRSNGVGAPAGSKVATNGTSTNAGGASLNGSSNGDTHPSASQHDGDPEPPVPPTYRGHNREEVTRLLMQALGDMGYKDAAESVSRDSGVALESETVSTFRRAILSGSWSQAESLLQGMTDAGAGDASSGLGGSRASQGNGLVLTKGANRNIMRFWIRQQKYLEYLELEDVARALAVLREELNPIANDQAKVQFLSSLLMCERPDDVKAKAAWDGANGNSRRRLLSELSSK